MKALVLAAVLLSTPALASAVETVRIPTDCTPIAMDYTTGGDNSSVVYVKVLCRQGDDTNMYLSAKTNVGGLFGFGRINLPSRIKLVKDPKLSTQIIWD